MNLLRPWVSKRGGDGELPPSTPFTAAALVIIANQLLSLPSFTHYGKFRRQLSVVRASGRQDALDVTPEVLKVMFSDKLSGMCRRVRERVSDDTLPDAAAAFYAIFDAAVLQHHFDTRRHFACSSTATRSGSVCGSCGAGRRRRRASPNPRLLEAGSVVAPRPPCSGPRASLPTTSLRSAATRACSSSRTWRHAGQPSRRAARRLPRTRQAGHS